MYVIKTVDNNLIVPASPLNALTVHAGWIINKSIEMIKKYFFDGGK